MFTKILIANRGEIACRVIRTARLLGIHTVAVYSDADAHAQHVAMADEAVHIGAAPARESYLLGERIIAAALQTGARAIHPGYGFLSENPDFCRACAANNLVFIGPDTEAIIAMGSKSAAKRIMEQAGVPLVPGYHGADQSPATLQDAARAMGYPVLLKATAGGGGKGMRAVHSDSEFDEALAAAKREAKNGFGDDTMLVEKYLTQPRHVEIQVFCDRHGNAVYLFERDCSVQRRHQKVIEEAPAPGISPALRAAMGEAAVCAARAIDYVGAGTVEFLLDTDGAFYFMEMNTRLQVEHPVTEMITGLDLVEWQLRVAAGEPLPLQQTQLQRRGHAFEARIYAEDPDHDFLPQTGVLSFLQPPRSGPHVRVDSGVRQGDEVSIYYDPMIAKLIVWDENRPRALQRLRRALQEFHISGLTTNISFLQRLAATPAFAAAELDTGFISKHEAELFAASGPDLHRTLPLAALYLYLQARSQRSHLLQSQFLQPQLLQLQPLQLQPLQPQQQPAPASPWSEVNGWRLNQHGSLTLTLVVHTETGAHAAPQSGIPIRVTPLAGTLPDACHQVRLDGPRHSAIAQGTLWQEHGATLLRATIDGHQCEATVARCGSGYSLYTQGDTLRFHEQSQDFSDQEDSASHGSLTAPMNGTVVTLLAAPGQTVAAGDTLLVMEAMKMEHAIKAPGAGTVREFFFGAGDLVRGGAELLAFTPAETGGHTA